MREKVPADLLEPGFHDAVFSLIEPLSRAVSSFYYECRLGDSHSPNADMLISFAADRSERLQKILNDGMATAGLNGLRNFVQRWCSNGDTLNSHVSALWLEFDRVADRTVYDRPSPSVCLVPDYHNRDDILSDNGRDVYDLIMDALQALQVGDERLALLSKTIESIVTVLPRQARVIHLSHMDGRERANCKLYCLIPRHEFLPFLSAAGWGGPLDELELLLCAYCSDHRVGGQLYVDITVDDFHIPGGGRLGLTFTPQHLLHSEERDPARVDLLQDLFAAGLCTENWLRTLLKWPSRERILWQESRWPSIVERWLDIKLVWQQGEEIEAKAYLGFSARAAGLLSRP